MLIVSRCHLRKTPEIIFHFPVEHLSSGLCSVGNQIFVQQLQSVVADVMRSASVFSRYPRPSAASPASGFCSALGMTPSDGEQMSPFVAELVPLSVTACMAEALSSPRSAGCELAFLYQLSFIRGPSCGRTAEGQRRSGPPEGDHLLPGPLLRLQRRQLPGSRISGHSSASAV